MKAERKVTVMLPDDLLKRAMKASGEGVTPTLRKALEMLALKGVYQELLKLRGKHPELKFDLKASREDKKR